MPFEASAEAAPYIAANEINARFPAKDAIGVVGHALSTRGNIALVSSFGTESVVLLHMVANVDKAAPVLFLETGMLFVETLAYQQELADTLGLTNVQVIRPDPAQLLLRDTDGLLHQADHDACCDLRKVEPLERALAPFDGWITGRKRVHGGQRVTLELAEADGTHLKFNPLAHWSAEDIRNYMDEHDLPRHPLSAKGFSSVGCAPCTSRVKSGEDPRAGRWRGSDKNECGIHFVGGKVVRA